VNWTHLRTFVWLRWRLAVNQMRRSGSGGVAISAIFTALMVAGAVVGLLIGLAIGLFPLRTAAAPVVMAVWDGAIVGFLFFWMVGLISELQRADALSLDRFLHLPVSPTGVFLINYLGSSISLSLVLFLPAMVGLSAGLVISRGAAMVPLFPLVAAFFLMITALTYQFRGWLASMMANPRRRRTIMAVVPLIFIVLVQLPNLWNITAARERRAARGEARKTVAALDQELAAGRITKEEYDARRPPPPPAADPSAVYDVARRVNMVAPPGWLAYGAEAAAEGRRWPPAASMIGMALIGVLSLRRSYATTLRVYKGDFKAHRRLAPQSATAPAAPMGAAPALRQALFMETRLPWVSDRASAVAMNGLRSWMRAPELKMMLLTPLIMLVIFTGMFQSSATDDGLRTAQATGLVAFMLVIGMVGPVGNQFGFDRGGFRTFVLSPVPRRDVLMGKNLSVLPYAVASTGVVLAVSQWFNPIGAVHLAAILVQTITMYLVICMAANLLSIIAPMGLKPGSSMPARHQGIRHLYSILSVLVIPVLLGLTLLPLGIELLLGLTPEYAHVPAYLGLGSVQAIVAVWLYPRVLARQGDLLQRREQRILEIVATRTE
jgi:ABC-2 type transport system permease protein